jgi:hypothetical protein
MPNRVHKSPQVDPILSHINPVQNLTLQFLKSHFNIVLPSMPYVFQVVYSLQVFELKFYVYSSTLPYVLHAQPISSSLIHHRNIW